MDPKLDALSDELQRLGYTVVPHGDHLCVRLPLASSVRIRLADGRLRLSPQFGPLSRTAGLVATSVVAAAGVGIVAFGIGALAPTLFAAFLGVLALAHDACRFVVTEGALTRLQQVATETRLLPPRSQTP